MDDKLKELEDRQKRLEEEVVAAEEALRKARKAYVEAWGEFFGYRSQLINTRGGVECMEP